MINPGDKAPAGTAKREMIDDLRDIVTFWLHPSPEIPRDGTYHGGPMAWGAVQMKQMIADSNPSRPEFLGASPAWSARTMRMYGEWEEKMRQLFPPSS